LRQGTFTPLVHAHAGRTQPGWSGRSESFRLAFKFSHRRSTGTLAGFVLVDRSVVYKSSVGREN
ncbi:hypothetical protein, partial [Phormidesmis sp. 146-33]